MAERLYSNAVSLTNGSAASPSTDFERVCWCDVFDWPSGIDTLDDVCQYFVESFTGFLEEKGMSIKADYCPLQQDGRRNPVLPGAESWTKPNEIARPMSWQEHTS